MVYAKHPTLAAKLANRYLSPTWEVTNTFLVFVVVAFLGFFPKAAFTLNGNVRTRYVNSSTRGNSQYIYGICLFLPKYQHLLRIISGITGLLIPALLITVLPVTEGAYITMSEGKKYSYMENFFLVLLFIVICSSD